MNKWTDHSSSSVVVKGLVKCLGEMDDDEDLTEGAKGGHHHSSSIIHSSSIHHPFMHARLDLNSNRMGLICESASDWESRTDRRMTSSRSRRKAHHLGLSLMQCINMPFLALAKDFCFWFSIAFAFAFKWICDLDFCFYFYCCFCFCFYFFPSHFLLWVLLTQEVAE